MTDSNDQTDKTIRVGARKPLSLQRTVESGHVRQNFSHGRSKSVVVEKKKTRRLGSEGEGTAPPAPSAVTIEKSQAPHRVPPAPPSQSSGDRSAGRVLSNEERAARERALAAARAEDTSRVPEAEPVRFEPVVRPPEPQPRAEERPQTAPSEQPTVASSVAPAAQAPEQAAAQASAPAAAAAQPASAPTPPPAGRGNAPQREPRHEGRRDGGGREGGRDAGHAPRGDGGRPQFNRGPRPSGNTAFMPREAGRPREIELPIPARRGASAGPADATTIEKPSRPVRPPVVREQVEDDDARKRGPGGVKVPRPAVKTNDDGRQRQKLTITNFDREAQVRSLASLKRKREKEKLKAMGIQQTREKIAREVVIPEAITIQELSNRMAERAVDLIKYLMQQGAMHKITDVLDADTAELIVQEFGHTSKRVSESDVEIGFVGEKDVDDSSLESRAPVVTIMGHVDHGKTSLLDAIRQANVVSGEAGGITQHIGAYQVTAPDGDKITFIDTPGHEAFTAMRARGAKVTDIVVLVVAADDGVMPQTVEAINHAKAANVPIIVAINKIDKPQADPNRVRTELLSYEIVVESMGGETLEVPVSALKHTNLDKLLEAIRLQAEILDLKANPNRTADGVVIEAKLERGRGPVGTVLVQRGTLHVGDIIVAGTAWGRVRALLNDHGANIQSAGPSVPAEVLGFDSAPEAGDQFAVVENEARARELTDYRVRKRRETLGSAGTKSTLEQMMQQLKDAGRKEFPLVVKGDVQGSVEAIAGALKKVGNEEVEARLVHSGVGGITESDIALAAAAKAVVIGFNVRANAQAKQAADAAGVEIRYYNIIYDLVDEVKAAMSGLLAPTRREVFLGYATIKQVFNISKAGKVAGCIVTEGKVERGAKVRLLRDNVVIHEGTLAILKRFKDDVKEVVSGQECGMSFANYQDIREGDQIECFQVETIARSL
ncbi:translation initiation factor IF-2 [Hyphomicrobium sp. MC1]|uniref:translation initiation factor IF-2 n=1 Tax=Hyphomicrobium sp. (strain MC1) TaxID=717785 RepID=UPI000213F28A|nr:translation initiation factor IF-2 [Hyphomicrobium sp. MC1]CCB67972.1 Translation initiation factor IF-2 [Hyphomicrobium sp. MC1]